MMDGQVGVIAMRLMTPVSTIGIMAYAVKYDRASTVRFVKLQTVHRPLAIAVLSNGCRKFGAKLCTKQNLTMRGCRHPDGKAR